MTHITPRLVRAVIAARTATNTTILGEEVDGHTRKWTQALIADLLLEEPPYAERSGETYNAGFDNGYALAIYHMRKRAGLVKEGE